MRPVARLSLAALLTALLAASCGGAGSAEGFGQEPSPAGRPAVLAKGDAAKLALFVANREPIAILGIVARKGRIGEIAGLAASLGGRVDYRLDAIDYATLVLPTTRIADVLASDAVEAVALDNLRPEHSEQIYWLSSAEPQGPANASPGGTEGAAPALPARPLEQAHLVLADMGGLPFKARDPRFDGRGTVIAHIEGFPDFLSPELATALDREGRRIPKFLDGINVPAPTLSLDGSGSRRGEMWTSRLGPERPSDGLELGFEGRTYRLPRAGRFRLGHLLIPTKAFWALPLLPLLKNLPRTGEIISIPVLWSDRERTAWLDSNGDGSFADEAGVIEYRSSRTFGLFGRDDPSTPVRETIGFALQKDGDFLSFNFGAASHPTMVAGAAAASRGEQGRIEGIAPGAQLLAISAMAENSSAAFVRSLAIAYLDPRVDVVLVQGNIAILGPAAPKAGRTLMALVLSRLVDAYPKPTFVTAINFPHMSAAADFSIPGNVLSIGASESAQSLFAHYGFKVRGDQALHRVGAEGPSDDGKLKPDLLAPANPVSLVPRDRTSAAESTYPGVFRLPVGYTICAGTSCAAPVAAGAAALLVGAARQKGLHASAGSMHSALRDTARFIAEIPAYKQGHGVLDLDAAWLRLNHPPDTVADRIEIAAPVRSLWSDALPRPHLGEGLFEREGWRVGDEAERMIILTRREGEPGDRNFRIDWRGNDGSFASPASVTLPLGKPVALPITVSARTAGAHSATMRLFAPQSDGPAAVVPATIVAPIAWDPKFRWTGTIDLQRPGRHNLFFAVPAGASLFTVSIKTGRKNVGLMLVDPGHVDDSVRYLRTDQRGEARLTVEAPTAGTWEVVLYDRQDAEEFDWSVADEDFLPPSKVEVSAAVLGADIIRTGRTVEVRNRLGPFEGKIITSALGGRRSLPMRIEPGKPGVVDIEVEEGQELLLVEIEGSDLDVDLHLFDCTSGTCWTSRRGIDRGSTERLIVEQPKAGRWKAVVALTGPATGPARILFSDTYLHPRLGSLVSGDELGERESGATWTAETKLWRRSSPRAGYAPIGLLQLVAEDLPLIELEAMGSRFSPPPPKRLPRIALEVVEL